MAEQNVEKAALTVTIFGRPIEVSAEDFRTTMTVLSLLTAHEPFQAAEQDALRDALDLIKKAQQSATTPPEDQNGDDHA